MLDVREVILNANFAKVHVSHRKSIVFADRGGQSARFPKGFGAIGSALSKLDLG